MNGKQYVYVTLPLYMNRQILTPCIASLPSSCMMYVLQCKPHCFHMLLHWYFRTLGISVCDEERLWCGTGGGLAASGTPSGRSDTPISLLNLLSSQLPALLINEPPATCAMLMRNACARDSDCQHSHLQHNSQEQSHLTRRTPHCPSDMLLKKAFYSKNIFQSEMGTLRRKHHQFDFTRLSKMSGEECTDTLRHYCSCRPDRALEDEVRSTTCACVCNRSWSSLA